MIFYAIWLYRLDVVAFAAGICLCMALARRMSRKHHVLGGSAWKPWLCVFLVVAAGVALAEISGRRKQMVARELTQSSVADYAFDLSHMEHRKVDTKTLPGDERYRELLSAEEGWLALNSNLHDLFTCRQRSDGRWIVIVHTSRGGYLPVSHFPVGYEYPLAGNEALERAWHGNAVFDPEPVRRDHRWVLSAYQPVVDADGGMDAVLIANFFVDRWYEQTLLSRAEALAAVFLAFAVGLGLVYIARQRSILTERAAAEGKLRESENRFRTLFENLPNIAVQGYDRNRRVIFWNDASAALYGYSREEALGRQLEDLIIPTPMRDDVIAGVQRWIGTGVPIPASEMVLKRKDGGPVSVFSSHVMQRRWDGEPEMYCVDIALAERDRALAALADSETNYRMLFEMVPHPIIVYDTETLRVLTVNSAALEHYGYSQHEFGDIGIPDTLVPEELPVLMRHLREAPASGRYGPAEWHNLRRNREIFVIETLSQAMTWNGRKARIVVVQDITQRKEAERRIREQAELLNKSTEAIVAVDSARTITFWNEGASRLFGLSAAEQVGQRLDTAGTGKQGGAWPEVLRHFGGSTDEWRGEVHTADAEGRPLYVETNIAVIRDARGVPTAQLCVSTDITRRKMLEAQVVQAQKMEVLGRLAGGVAHDFNSFLMAMSLHLEMLAMDLENNPKAIGTIHDIQGMTGRASKLIGQLLLFARRHAMAPEPLELNAALAGVTKLLQRLLGADVTLKLKGGGEIWIRADALMIDQVVMNLCVNARDAMPQGGTLTVEAKRMEFQSEAPFSEGERRKGQFACLSVSDTGCGMTQEVRQHIFEPFFTTKEAGKGTGLGLSTVHGIVHQHEGWITVDSEEGKGSTFHIFLPMCDRPEPAGRDGEESAVRGGDETILLVDDDEYVRRTCAAMLLKIGYRVLPCGDGRSALRVWEQNRGSIDLLLSDVILSGGMNGVQLAEQLKTRQPSLCVVLMSGFSEAIMNADAMKAKGYDFVSKPMQTAQLAETIRAALDRD